MNFGRNFQFSINFYFWKFPILFSSFRFGKPFLLLHATEPERRKTEQRSSGRVLRPPATKRRQTTSLAFASTTCSCWTWYFPPARPENR
ncbi:hypothetical protein RchiOBHm_Chr6g0254651 [Rosa chinensis]|uniref:Uncharacterized protein n=1 Tax=Rosa chinensis TaxID=74649 RepID=A0A2P6PLN9_ROSCH|nr:hypothetical protein RchiOBHm_Chr6g0254651 [Rosa chinensis]